MKTYFIIAKSEQYENIMRMMYDMEIFPMEEGPTDVEDYIHNFRDMCEEIDGGLLRFNIGITTVEDKTPDFSDFIEKMTAFENYDKEANLPRIEADPNE